MTLKAAKLVGKMANQIVGKADVNPPELFKNVAVAASAK